MIVLHTDLFVSNRRVFVLKIESKYRHNKRRSIYIFYLSFNSRKYTETYSLEETGYYYPYSKETENWGGFREISFVWKNKHKNLHRTLLLIGYRLPRPTSCVLYSRLRAGGGLLVGAQERSNSLEILWRQIDVRRSKYKGLHKGNLQDLMCRQRLGLVQRKPAPTSR